MKTKLLIILCLGISLKTNFAYSQGAAVQLNDTVVASAVNEGANAAQAQEESKSCGGFFGSPQSCMIAILAVAQIALSFAQGESSTAARDALSPGTDFSNPDIKDDLGPIDPKDDNVMDPIVDAITVGTNAAYVKAHEEVMKQLQPTIDKLAEEGYTVDTKAGTITTPTGTQSLSSLSGTELDSRFDDYVDNVLAALGKIGSGSSVAGSTGGSGSSSGRAVSSLNSKSSVDKFLNKLDKGQLDSNKLAGMSVTTKDGEPIGVAMGNLFKTIQLKYQSLNTQNEFK